VNILLADNLIPSGKSKFWLLLGDEKLTVVRGCNL
jgi:hypothetical protein